MPRMRLDFIFASPQLLHSEDSLSRWTTKEVKGPVSRLVAAGIEKSSLTNDLSDHYPVFLSWYDDVDPFG